MNASSLCEAQADPALVTTVIRLHNRRDAVLRAVASAIAQSLRDQPIIIVDDASDDHGADAVEQAFGGRVRVIRRPVRGGAGAAANTGIRAAETRYVAFLDSDDTWEPQFLEKLVGALEANPAASLAYSDMRYCLARYCLDRYIQCAGPGTDPKVMAASPLSLSLVVVRRRAALAAGPFREDVRVGEDTDFYMRLWLRNPSAFVHVEEALAHRNVDADNLTNQSDNFVRDLEQIMDRHLRNPGFRYLEGQRSLMTEQHLMAALARRTVLKWLSREPKRTVTVVLRHRGDADDAVDTLSSLARQRLGPVDVVIQPEEHKHKMSAQIAAAAQEWPFRLHVGGAVTDKPPVIAMQRAIAGTTGEILIFLESGDILTDDALDTFRRAFSSNLRSVSFAYCGVNGNEAGAIPAPVAKAAEIMITDGVPGTLSAVAFNRKHLLASRALLDFTSSCTWLTLILYLIGGKRIHVRIKQPLVRLARPQIHDRDAMLAALFSFSETDAGRALSGLYDSLADQPISLAQPQHNAGGAI